MYKRRGFFGRIFDFSGWMNRGEFWTELGLQMISMFCAVIVLMIVLVSVLPLDTEQLIEIANNFFWVPMLLWVLPIVKNTRKRLRDAGYSAKSYLWLLLPIIGWAIFILLLFAKSVPRKPDTPYYF